MYTVILNGERNSRPAGIGQLQERNGEALATVEQAILAYQEHLNWLSSLGNYKITMACIKDNQGNQVLDLLAG